MKLTMLLQCVNTLPAGEQVSKCQTATKAQFQSFMGGILSEAPKRKREKKLLVNILQPLVRDKYMSASLAIKCASSGLGLHHLQVVYQRKGRRGEASSDGEVW